MKMSPMSSNWCEGLTLHSRLTMVIVLVSLLAAQVALALPVLEAEDGPAIDDKYATENVGGNSGTVDSKTFISSLFPGTMSFPFPFFNPFKIFRNIFNTEEKKRTFIGDGVKVPDAGQADEPLKGNADRVVIEVLGTSGGKTKDMIINKDNTESKKQEPFTTATRHGEGTLKEYKVGEATSRDEADRTVGHGNRKIDQGKVAGGKKEKVLGGSNYGHANIDVRRKDYQIRADNDKEQHNAERGDIQNNVQKAGDATAAQHEEMERSKVKGGEEARAKVKGGEEEPTKVKFNEVEHTKVKGGEKEQVKVKDDEEDQAKVKDGDNKNKKNDIVLVADAVGRSTINKDTVGFRNDHPQTKFPVGGFETNPGVQDSHVEIMNVDDGKNDGWREESRPKHGASSDHMDAHVDTKHIQVANEMSEDLIGGRNHATATQESSNREVVKAVSKLETPLATSAENRMDSQKEVGPTKNPDSASAGVNAEGMIWAIDTGLRPISATPKDTESVQNDPVTADSDFNLHNKLSGVEILAKTPTDMAVTQPEVVLSENEASKGTKIAKRSLRQFKDMVMPRTQEGQNSSYNTQQDEEGSHKSVAYFMKQGTPNKAGENIKEVTAPTTTTEGVNNYREIDSEGAENKYNKIDDYQIRDDTDDGEDNDEEYSVEQLMFRRRRRRSSGRRLLSQTEDVNKFHKTKKHSKSESNEVDENSSNNSNNNNNNNASVQKDQKGFAKTREDKTNRHRRGVADKTSDAKPQDKKNPLNGSLLADATAVIIIKHFNSNNNKTHPSASRPSSQHSSSSSSSSSNSNSIDKSKGPHSELKAGKSGGHAGGGYKAKAGGKTSRHVPNDEHQDKGKGPGGKHNSDHGTGDGKPGPKVDRVTRPNYPAPPIRPSPPVDLAWKRHQKMGRHGAAILCFLSIGFILFVVLILAVATSRNEADGPRRTDSSTALYVRYPHY